MSLPLAGKSTVSTTSKSVMRMSRRGLGSMLPICGRGRERGEREGRRGGRERGSERGGVRGGKERRE